MILDLPLLSYVFGLFWSDHFSFVIVICLEMLAWYQVDIFLVFLRVSESITREGHAVRTTKFVVEQTQWTGLHGQWLHVYFWFQTGRFVFRLELIFLAFEFARWCIIVLQSCTIALSQYAGVWKRIQQQWVVRLLPLDWMHRENLQKEIPIISFDTDRIVDPVVDHFFDGLYGTLNKPTLLTDCKS